MDWPGLAMSELKKARHFLNTLRLILRSHGTLLAAFMTAPPRRIMIDEWTLQVELLIFHFSSLTSFSALFSLFRNYTVYTQLCSVSR